MQEKNNVPEGSERKSKAEKEKAHDKRRAIHLSNMVELALEHGCAWLPPALGQWDLLILLM